MDQVIGNRRIAGDFDKFRLRRFVERLIGVQHEYDGAPYISSGIDFTLDPVTKRSNVGCRRLMLRSKDKCGFNVTALSDLRQIYLGCVARSERLQTSFTIAAHPLDTMAAASRGQPGQDEVGMLATLRGEPLPLVKCLTNDLYVPAAQKSCLKAMSMSAAISTTKDLTANTWDTTVPCTAIRYFMSRRSRGAGTCCIRRSNTGSAASSDGATERRWSHWNRKLRPGGL
jgi:3-octaprenyl-4-hydroxybenzoate carboxy-lyase